MLKTKQKIKLKKFIISRTGDLVKQDPSKISLTQPFSLIGLSSLDGIQLIADINNFLGTEYSPTVLFDYPNISELLKFLSNPEEHKINFEDSIDDNKARFVNEPIAVVGMACNFPGAENLEEFEELLFKNKDAVTEVDESRWRDKPKDLKAWGGFISKPDAFDNQLFDIYEKEASFLDPQQRKILELAWLSLEHAGYNPEDLSNTNTGVYIGISSNDYSLARARTNKVEIFDGLGGAHSIAANRISYFFNFHGPSWAVDTACSSSLIAVSQAVGHLRSSECNMALAGGINILYTSHLTESFTKAGMLSPDGRCKTFSDDANGYVRGEGGGVVVLKRLSDAKRDGDKIWGLIRGFSYNQDGKSNGITAPNGLAQENVIKRALKFSHLKPEEIDYIEAHGTGTSLGDPIEFQALKSTFSNRENNLLLGSVKTNIGHLEAAAGIAGIMKILLAMKNKEIPAQLHFKKLNTKINNENSHIEIVSKNTPWKYLEAALFIVSSTPKQHPY